MEQFTLPTYIINLPERKDRRMHIKEQFKGRQEFDVSFIEACHHKIGAVGLWYSIRKIVKIALKNGDDVIIICEDDHNFTSNYNKEVLVHNIFRAHEIGCNVLSGGIGGFNAALPVTDQLLWINSFWCTQFIVVFKRFFHAILEESFSDSDTADGKFSEMTSQKMVIHPFISEQKDFGYSDVTRRNNEKKGLITQYFKDTDERLQKLQRFSLLKSL